MSLNWDLIKKSGYVSPYIYIKNADHKGLGVFAKTDIQKDTIIEYCHSIVLNSSYEQIKDHKVCQYTYTYYTDKEVQMAIMPLGFGMIYNSGDKEDEANTEYSVIENEHLVVFKTIKDVSKDEELLVWWSQKYYNYWIKGYIKKEGKK